jgi:hypothetical protein
MLEGLARPGGGRGAGRVGRVNERIAGARYAFRVAHPAAPMLRVRYRHGVPVDPRGFPDWTPYARLLVALPPSIADLTVEESRIVDVCAAGVLGAFSGDPVWTDVYGTPPGWTWAHVAQTRHLALVPVELHASFRHLGGVSVGGSRAAGRGLVAGSGSGEAPRILVTERLAPDAVALGEEILGVRLPEAYRDYLARTNGGGPAAPAVHPGYGFVLDQPLFGFRDDRTQDLGYMNAWFGDRLTADWRAIGYVQGGLLTLQVRGDGAGTVGYLDDDDARDRDHFTAEEICDRLLHRLAPDFATFWTALRPIPAELVELAGSTAAGGHLAFPEGLGALLPTSHRPAGR